MPPSIFQGSLSKWCTSKWPSFLLFILICLAAFAVPISASTVFANSNPESAFGINSSADSTSDSVVRTDSSVDVTGDDSVDAYRGTGGLLLPSSYSGSASSRKKIAECLDCIWRFTIYCDQEASGFCAHALTTCPRGEIRYRVWFGKVNQASRVVGTVCWGISKPATRRDVETEVNDSALRYVPTLNPGVAPHGGTFTSVPINVWAGQPVVFTPAPMYLAGHQVRIRALATWQWNWGDGSTIWTTKSGSKYPFGSLRHQYLQPGKYRVQVHTLWRATYEVKGIGTFTSAGDLIHQNAQFSIQVKSARAVLVAN